MATITLRSVKGSPLTNNEVDTNFSNLNNDKLESSSYTASDVLTKIKTVDGAASGLDADLLDGQQGSYYAALSGSAFTGNVTLGDNVKTIFGTGSDLEIYHDGSHSYITDAGTGNLKIAASQIDLLGGSDGAETMATFVDDGAVTLYYDNASKLVTTTTGIAIPGSATSAADIKLYEDTDTGTNYVAFKAPSSIASDLTWTLPSTDGSSGQALVTNGTGTLSWAAAGASITDDNATNATRYLVWEDATSGTSTSVGISSSKLSFNPSTGLLSVNGGVSIPDNAELYIGTGNDLQIYHDGSNSYITDAGTGTLNIRASNSITLATADGLETYATFVINGASTLYYDNSVKLATSSSGITVTGGVTCDGLSMGDSEIANFGASNDLQIYHDGSNSYIDDTGTGSLNIRSSGLNLVSADGLETYAQFVLNGASTLYYDNSAKLATESGGVAVTGTLTATGDITSNFSDKRLKNIEGTISNALEKVTQISGVYYTQNEIAESMGFGTDNSRRVGVIAQEIKEILPEAVKAAPFDTYMIEGVQMSKSGENYMTVQYEKLVPLLIEAIKELNKQVEQLKNSKE